MAVVVTKGVYVVAGKRTAFGKLGGALREMLPQDLFGAAARAAIETAGISPQVIDTVNIGQISSTSPGGMAPRHAALAAGLPQKTPAVGTNMLSGSAFNAAVISTQEILLGSAQISLAGGMEVLSGIPFLVRGLRTEVPLGKPIVFEDSNLTGLFDTYCNMSVIETSEKLAKIYGVTREELDMFALRSQRNWKVARDKGFFDAEVVPVVGTVKGEQILVKEDENPRPDMTLEKLTKLPALSKNNLLTPGNCCGINDGAGAVILASEEALRQHNLKPLSRVAGWCRVGVDPTIMGIGPAVAIRRLLDTAQLGVDDVDLFELHETNAATSVVCAKELGVDDSKLNLNGGAIAIGHPSGASGARLMSHITHELRRKSLKRGVAAVCVAGGQGIAVLIENV